MINYEIGDKVKFSNKVSARYKILSVDEHKHDFGTLYLYNIGNLIKKHYAVEHESLIKVQ